MGGKRAAKDIVDATFYLNRNPTLPERSLTSPSGGPCSELLEDASFEMIIELPDGNDSSPPRLVHNYLKQVHVSTEATISIK